jgi:hypothetical protein
VRKLMSPHVKTKLTSWSLHCPPLVKDGAIVWNASVVPVGRSFDRLAAVHNDLSKNRTGVLEGGDVSLDPSSVAFCSSSVDVTLLVPAMIDVCMDDDLTSAFMPFYTRRLACSQADRNQMLGESELEKDQSACDNDRPRTC